MDLNHRSALIPRKLLIPRYAKTAQSAKKANLFYTFFTLCLGSELSGFGPFIGLAADSSPFYAIAGAHHLGPSLPPWNNPIISKIRCGASTSTEAPASMSSLILYRRTGQLAAEPMRLAEYGVEHRAGRLNSFSATSVGSSSPPVSDCMTSQEGGSLAQRGKQLTRSRFFCFWI